MNRYKMSIDALIQELREKIAAGGRNLASTTVYGGHEKTLRQTLVVISAGGELGEHDSPGEATVYVVSGRVKLKTAENTWEGRTGNLLVVPPDRHSVEAVEDSAFLLTVAKC